MNVIGDSDRPEWAVQPGPAAAPGRKTSRGQFAVNILLAVILLAGAGVFVWGADRGFDLSDEGVYLLDYQNPEAFQAGFTSYQRVGAVLFDAVGRDIVWLRLAGFGMLVAATAFFWAALSGFLRDTGLFRSCSRGEAWALGLTTGVSVLPAFCWPPPTPSYNTMAGIALLVAAGGFLLAMRPGAAAPRGGGIFVFGAAAVLLLFVKGSSAVGLLVFCAVMLAVWPLIPLRSRFGILAGLAVLTVVAGGVAFFLIPGAEGGREFLVYSVASLLKGEGASGLISRHWGEAWDLAGRTLRSYYFPIVVALAGVVWVRIAERRWPKAGGDRGRLVVVLAALGCVAGAAVAKDGFFAGIEFRNGSLLPYSALFVVLAVLAIGLPGREPVARRVVAASVVLVLWLAALPFVGSAGTTHRLYVNALLHLAPFFAACVLLAVVVDRRMKTGVAVPATALLIGLLAAGQFYSGFVANPYRLATSKGGQNEPAQIGAAGSVLKVDPATAEFLAEVRGILTGAGFQPGGDIVGLFDLPGVVFAAGGASPGRPWYFSGYGDTENIRSLEAAGAPRIRRAFILQTAEDPRVATYLEALGIRLDDEYRMIGEAWHPYRRYSVRVWAPQNE